MSDEKLFQYLVSRVQTRETSTHTVATIASSASIILFVLYFSGNLSDADKVAVRLLGIILPMIGFAYFEVVFGTQQRWDYENITEMINKESTLPQKKIDEIIFGKNRAKVLPKMALWRILLSLPIVIWIIFDQELEWIILTMVYTAEAIAILMVTVERSKKSQKSDNNSEPDR